MGGSCSAPRPAAKVHINYFDACRVYHRLGPFSLRWVQRLSEWASSAFPQGNVEVVNGAYPGINSAYMSACLSVRVQTEGT